jgi:hypothetical protein
VSIVTLVEVLSFIILCAFALALTCNTLSCNAAYLNASVGSKCWSDAAVAKQEQRRLQREDKIMDEAARKRRLTFDEAVAIRDGRQPATAHMSIDMALRMVANSHAKWPAEFPRDA